MREAIPYFLSLLFLCISVSAQQNKKNEVDSLITKYIEQRMYGSASELMVNYAIEEQNKGNLEAALEYQIKNCELVEQHAVFFGQNGLTLQDLFNNYGMVFVLQRDLGKDTLAIKSYLDLAKIVVQYSPPDLPFYTDLIASTMGLCRDSLYADSIYHLQDALDIIAKQPANDDNVRKFVWFCKCFNANRQFNSFCGNVFKKNRIDEIIQWYNTNSPYILSLDTTKYKSNIVDYVTNFADELYLYAGTISSQQRDLIKSIDLYNREISVLSSIVSLEDSILQKIASCYAQIASNYFQLGDNARCKEYSDKTIHYLFNHKNNLEYCDILNILALNYYNTHQSSLAAKIELEEIHTREELGERASISDWAQYMMYIVDTNPQEVIKKKNLIIDTSLRASHSPHTYFYLMLGRAYSMLMTEREEYKDSAGFCFNKADSIIHANEDYYRKYDQLGLVKRNLYEEWASHYSRLNKQAESYYYSKEALRHFPDNFYSYYKPALKASFLHDIEGIHNYLPKYFYGMEDELFKMIPTLGSVESDVYLGNGESNLYHIPEWSSWNPTDTISISVAYDAALLMKGLTLRYNTIAPYISNNPFLIISKQTLDSMRDSIYTITEDNQRILALYRYEQKERELLKGINENLVNVHWQEVKKHLKENEVCLEFVKFTKNAYNWSVGTPKPHYAALVLSKENDYPIFIDLFDEDELYDTYTLQPKSYDTEVGSSLYNRLWGQLSKHIKEKNKVYFSPMGMLNLINVEALVNKEGKTALDEYNLIRLSSTKQLLSSIEQKSISSVISFGGIDYEEMAFVIADSLNTRGNWNYLKNSLTEIQNVEYSLHKNNVESRPITGSKATEESFKSLSGTTANVIHIASHGFYIPSSRRNTIPYYAKSIYTQKIQDELFYSGLIMSGGQKAWTESSFAAEKNDGILTSYEISKLDLHNVDLVVLSACETGLGDNLFDGIFGLQRALKKAGVKSILMSLWSINDKATSEYMDLFYSFLTSGLSKHESYKRTVAEMKKRYEDPDYWASFILLD